MKKKKTEYKKIALAVVGVWSIALVTVLAFSGTGESIAVALIYTVLGSYIAYCGASATDKLGMNKYRAKYPEEEEEDINGLDL